MTAETKVYEIHPANLDALKADLEAMKRRARKLNCDPIVIEELGTKMIEVTKIISGKKVKFQSPRVLMTVTGNLPKLEGWSLVAKIEYLGEERLIRCVPGEECPEEFRTRGIECDHCKSQRYRKDVFALRHEDGRHVQVGRQCIRDFLGGVSPEALMSAAQYVFQADGMLGEYDSLGGGFGGRGSDTIDIEEYLTGVSICIRRLGWVSRSEARFSDDSSTSGDAWYLLKPDLRTDKDKHEYERWVEKKNLAHQERDQKLAQETLEWAEALPTEGVGDFLYNLGVACRAGYVTRKTMGIVASAIQAYLREKEREEEIKPREKEDAHKVRGHVGTIKKREIFGPLTVRFMKYVEGFYGVKTLVNMEDETGNLIVWWASREVDELEKGDVVTVKATVREHGDYKGIKQTVVQRLVVEERHEEEEVAA